MSKNLSSPLWSDIQAAAERFPYATATRLLGNDRSREGFIARAGSASANVSPYETLRRLAAHKGKP